MKITSSNELQLQRGETLSVCASQIAKQVGKSAKQVLADIKKANPDYLAKDPKLTQIQACDVAGEIATSFVLPDYCKGQFKSGLHNTAALNKINDGGQKASGRSRTSLHNDAVARAEETLGVQSNNSAENQAPNDPRLTIALNTLADAEEFLRDGVDPNKVQTFIKEHFVPGAPVNLEALKKAQNIVATLAPDLDQRPIQAGDDNRIEWGEESISYLLALQEAKAPSEPSNFIHRNYGHLIKQWQPSQLRAQGLEARAQIVEEIIKFEDYDVATQTLLNNRLSEILATITPKYALSDEQFLAILKLETTLDEALTEAYGSEIAHELLAPYSAEQKAMVAEYEKSGDHYVRSLVAGAKDHLASYRLALSKSPGALEAFRKAREAGNAKVMLQILADVSDAPVSESAILLIQAQAAAAQNKSDPLDMVTDEEEVLRTHLHALLAETRTQYYAYNDLRPEISNTALASFQSDKPLYKNVTPQMQAVAATDFESINSYQNDPHGYIEARVKEAERVLNTATNQFIGSQLQADNKDKAFNEFSLAEFAEAGIEMTADALALESHMGQFQDDANGLPLSAADLFALDLKDDMEMMLAFSDPKDDDDGDPMASL